MSVSENYSNSKSEFHSCVRQVMRLSRWVGIFAVSGLDELTIGKLRCNTRSVYFIFNLLTIAFHFLIICLTFYHFGRHLQLANFTKCLFYCTSLVGIISLLRLARKWPTMTRSVARLEDSLRPMWTEAPRPVKFVSFAYILTSLAVIEHILSVNYKIKFIMNCMKERYLNYKVIEKYVEVHINYVFQFTTITWWKVALHKIVNLQATFVWSFVDIFITCVGMYLSHLFRELNKLVSLQVAQRSVNWSLIRQNYSEIMKILKQVNDNMSSFILLSFFTNMYYICLQLFYSTNRSYASHGGCTQEDVVLTIDSMDYSAYYVFSFLFLLLRSFLTSLMTVKVNIEAMKPLTALRSIQTEEYTLEVQRFVRQIRYCKPALSGICFSVTKEMLFTAMGAVITYEVVLLQNRRALNFSSADLNNNTYFTHFL